MKIAFTKKKILFSILLVVSVLLFTVLTLLYLQNKGVVNLLPIALDKYELISKHCSSKNTQDGKDFECKGIFNTYSIKGKNTECFDISILTNSNDLDDLTICEEDGYVEWDSKDILASGKKPVSIKFSYKEVGIAKYSLEGIDLKRLTDDDSYSVLFPLNENGYDIGDVVLNSDTNGYSYSISAEGTGYLSFDNVEIKEISVENKMISIKFQVEIKGETHLLTATTPYFIPVPYTVAETNTDEVLSDYVTIDNYTEFVLYKKASLLFLYVPSTPSLTENKFKEDCNSEETTNLLCFYFSRIDIEKMKIEDVDKKLLDILKSDNKIMNDFILFEVSENE